MIIPVLVFIAVVVALGVLAYEFSRRAKEVDEEARELQSPQTPTLTYVVPPGQDAAVVIGSLQHDGFRSTAEPEPGVAEVVLIEVPQDDPDTRARVRAAIRGADTTALDDGAPVHLPEIVFADER